MCCKNPTRRFSVSSYRYVLVQAFGGLSKLGAISRVKKDMYIVCQRWSSLNYSVERCLSEGVIAWLFPFALETLLRPFHQTSMILTS